MEHEWMARQTRLIGQAVAYWRQNTTDERGRPLTAQGLAERCTKLGLKIERPAIAKLENGHRQAVTVAEICVLAQALGVAPATLLFPIGYVPAVEVLPGREVDPWAAYEWFIGNSEDPDDPNAPPQLGTDSPVILWNEHLHWNGTLPSMAARQEREKLTGPPAHPVAEPEITYAIAALRRVRAAMRALSMTLPPLHPETARILGEED